jgi:hypothetical protein
MCRSSPDDGAAWKELDSLLEQEGPATEALRQVYEKLIDRYPCLSSLDDDDIDAHDSPWASGPLWGEFFDHVAHIGLTWSRADAALPFIIETAHSFGMTVFDLSNTRIHRAGGLVGLVLSVESRPEIHAPKLDEILAAVDDLTPDGGPGFLILVRSDKDYAQTAGGEGSYILEWREYSGDQFRHLIAGHLAAPGSDRDDEIVVPTNGAYVTARANERLSAADVKTLLTAFSQEAGRPNSFAWRDMTVQFI